jgi:mRNA interferase MazF
VADRSYTPGRGDIIWVNFDPQAGHEQAGRRPGLVISPSNYNQKTKMALICPITSRSKGYLFEIALPPGLPIGGVVLSDQIRSLDWVARQADFACVVPEEVVHKVLAKVALLTSA